MSFWWDSNKDVVLVLYFPSSPLSLFPPSLSLPLSFSRPPISNRKHFYFSHPRGGSPISRLTDFIPETLAQISPPQSQTSTKLETWKNTPNDAALVTSHNSRNTWPPTEAPSVTCLPPSNGIQSLLVIYYHNYNTLPETNNSRSWLMTFIKSVPGANNGYLRRSAPPTERLNYHIESDTTWQHVITEPRWCSNIQDPLEAFLSLYSPWKVFRIYYADILGCEIW